VTFVLENLNTAVDHPGTRSPKRRTVWPLVEAVDSPALKLMLDLYHAQIGEGNLIELVRRCGAAIGEIQVADVPGRCEPGTGEINSPVIARALAAMGYDCTIGLEAYASRDSELALQRFRDASASSQPTNLAAGRRTVTALLWVVKPGSDRAPLRRTAAKRRPDRNAASGASRPDPYRARFGCRLLWLCDITELGEPQPLAQQSRG
jgi:hypothetical protein